MQLLPQVPSGLPKQSQNVGMPDASQFLAPPSPTWMSPQAPAPTGAMAREQLIKLMMQRRILDQMHAIKKHPVFMIPGVSWGWGPGEGPKPPIKPPR